MQSGMQKNVLWG